MCGSFVVVPRCVWQLCGHACTELVCLLSAVKARTMCAVLSHSLSPGMAQGRSEDTRFAWETAPCFSIGGQFHCKVVPDCPGVGLVCFATVFKARYMRLTISKSWKPSLYKTWPMSTWISSPHQDGNNFILALLT
eukprot:scaffold247732_cov19-Tisochrysis_lutea.AAC.2